MAAVNASVAFATARALLNDISNTFFTDTVLLPYLVQSFRELEVELRVNNASIMRATTVVTVAISATTMVSLPTDINEPIKLWEKATGGTNATYSPMTEYDPLPNAVGSTTLRYWNWDGTNINFIASSVARSVRMEYWRVLTEPTAAGSSLVFINAEDYIAPRTAALAAGALGEEKITLYLTQVAKDALDKVIAANRGRSPSATKP